MGYGGTLIESLPLDRKVVGSNPALAATPGTLGKSFVYSCLQRFGVYTPTQDQLLWSGAPLSSRPSGVKEAL